MTAGSGRSVEHVQRFEFDTFVLDVEWPDRTSADAPELPRLVGPFPTIEAAQGWARLNAPEEAWTARPLAWPHYVSPEVGYHRGVQAAMRAVADVIQTREEGL